MKPLPRALKCPDTALYEQFKKTEGAHLMFELLLYLRQGHGSVLWPTPEKNTKS